jgi:hypothetical protein
MRVRTKRVLVAFVLLLAEIALAKKKKDYYQLLGVKRDADDATLKKAYRKVSLFCLSLTCGLNSRKTTFDRIHTHTNTHVQLALKLHPDRNPPDKKEQAEKDFSECANPLLGLICNGTFSTCS